MWACWKHWLLEVIELPWGDAGSSYPETNRNKLIFSSYLSLIWFPEDGKLDRKCYSWRRGLTVLLHKTGEQKLAGGHSLTYAILQEGEPISLFEELQELWRIATFFLLFFFVFNFFPPKRERKREAAHLRAIHTDFSPSSIAWNCFYFIFSRLWKQSPM